MRSSSRNIELACPRREAAECMPSHELHASLSEASSECHACLHSSAMQTRQDQQPQEQAQQPPHHPHPVTGLQQNRTACARSKPRGSCRQRRPQRAQRAGTRRAAGMRGMAGTPRPPQTWAWPRPLPSAGPPASKRCLWTLGWVQRRGPSPGSPRCPCPGGAWGGASMGCLKALAQVCWAHGAAACVRAAKAALPPHRSVRCQVQARSMKQQRRLELAWSRGPCVVSWPSRIYWSPRNCATRPNIDIGACSPHAELRLPALSCWRLAR